MTFAAFAAACLALLLAPGPTNTLIAIASARGGWVQGMRLMPAELAGYLAAILPLSLLGAEAVTRLPALGHVLTLAAAVWVMVLALRLWRLPGTRGAGVPITSRRVFLTTFLNPKALIFALILLPAPRDPAFALHLAGFGVMALGAALAWSGLGALTGSRANPGGLRLIQRGAALWLGLVAASLAFGGVPG